MDDQGPRRRGWPPKEPSGEPPLMSREYIAGGDVSLLQFETTADEIGDGWTDPAAAAERWNWAIATVLREIAQFNWLLAEHVAEWAGERFCQRAAGESDVAAASWPRSCARGALISTPSAPGGGGGATSGRAVGAVPS